MKEMRKRILSGDKKIHIDLLSSEVATSTAGGSESARDEGSTPHRSTTLKATKKSL